MQKDLRELEEAGIITRSTSPVVLVPKKYGTLRMCVDYRRLNDVSEADASLMPCIDELIDRLGGATYISMLDLTHGQVPVAPSSQPKTVFITPFELFQFTAPQHFWSPCYISVHDGPVTKWDW